jgi:hypothetical protein
MRFHTILKLGPNREVTKEGFTVFRNVSISRVGEQVYGPNEGTGIEPGPDGLIHITRTPDEVFRQEALDSCNGKSLVIDHPDDDVTPENWRTLSNGFMVNARRGTGDQRDECVADVFVTTPEAIAELDSGMREVSLGYDADYFETGPGRGDQRNYYINHLALVEAGRCGSRCAFKDHAINPKENIMSKIWDRLQAAIASKDEAAITRAVLDARAKDEDEEEEAKKKKAAEDKAKDEAAEERFKKVEDSIAKISDSVSKLAKDKAKDDEEEAERKKKEAEAKDKAKDEAEGKELEEEKPESSKAKDSASLEDSFSAVKAQAEIVAPGVQIPTFDAAADPKKTFRDCICGLRRKALQQATNDQDTAAMIETVRGRALDSAAIGVLTCGETRTLFNGVYALKKQANNAAAVSGSGSAARTADAPLTPMQRFKAASAAARNGIAKK